jgi:hypothetical protein
MSTGTLVYSLTNLSKRFAFPSLFLTDHRDSDDDPPARLPFIVAQHSPMPPSPPSGPLRTLPWLQPRSLSSMLLWEEVARRRRARQTRQAAAGRGLSKHRDAQLIFGVSGKSIRSCLWMLLSLPSSYLIHHYSIHNISQCVPDTYCRFLLYYAYNENQMHHACVPNVFLIHSEARHSPEVRLLCVPNVFLIHTVPFYCITPTMRIRCMRS